MRPDCLPGGFDPADIALPSTADQAPDDGGPMFPILQDGWTRSDAWGMSLRDHFAGLAMQGYIASMAPDEKPSNSADTMAGDAYLIADAMLRARKFPPSGGTHA